VPAVEYSLVHGVLHLERLHHGARIEVVDPEPTASHFVHEIYVLLGVVVEDVSGTPRTLHLQYSGIGT
jgi:hypothetical protein